MTDPRECWGCGNLVYTSYGFICNRVPRICMKDRSVTISWVPRTTVTAPPSFSVTTRTGETHDGR